MSKIRNIVITGGSNGIGKATIERLAQNNHKIFNIDRQPPANDQNQIYIPADLTCVEAIVKAFDQIHQYVQNIDVLISNAGKHFSADIEHTNEDDFDSVINTNVKSAFFVIQKTIPLMKENGGKIIVISSDQAFIGKPNSAVYGLTKSALDQLVKNLAIDYASYNIIVNSVCPGTIDTPLFRQAIANYSEKSGININEIQSAEEQYQPIGRIGKPDEVANLIHFLALEAKSFLTGSSIPIDGGYTAQ